MSLEKYSNYNTVLQRAKSYIGPDVHLARSTKKDKKYMVYVNGKWIHFGAMGYEDFTKHGDHDRRIRYLRRATNLPGNWKNNKYSPNNLAIHLLW